MGGKVRIAKSGDVPSIVKFAKGLITPEAITVTGALTPKQAKQVVWAIKEHNALLQKINYNIMNGLERFVDAYDIAEGVLKRVAEGSEPQDTDKTDLANIGCTLRALKVQLFGEVTRSTLENEADNPNLERDLFDKFTLRFGNELVKLGFAGVADDNLAGFTSLNKGWLQVARDSLDTAQDTYAAAATMVERLTALVGMLDADAKGPGTSILLSWADWEAYLLELGLTTHEASVIASGPTRTFLGYPLEVSKYMPAGVYLATPLQNLAFGVSSAVYRERGWHRTKRVVEYVFDLGCDYEIVVKKWVALLEAEPVGI